MKGTEARALLGKPWPLIPARDDDKGKRCIRKWKHLVGVAASTEYDDVDAPLWAIPTGRATGIVVLDFDGAEGLTTLTHSFAEGDCPNVRTGSGGYHLWVEAPPWPVKNKARCLSGMDVRGDGGVVYVAGASRKGPYEILHHEALHMADLPPSVAACLEPARPHKGQGVKPAPFALEGRPGLMGTLAFLERECERIRHALPGERNAIFNRSVFTVAGLVAAGELAEMWAKDELVNAALDMAPGDDAKLQVVFDSAWDAGMAEPWRIGPERIGG